MTPELPEGLKDPVAIARVACLHAEVQRLAHSSPPIAGRDAKIRELKTAVAVLRDYQFGFTSTKWFLSVYRSMAVGYLVTSLAVLVLASVFSGPRTVPTASGIVRGAGLLVIFLVAVGVWDFLRTRHRLRSAEALADSMVRDGIGSAKTR
jgi:hypothetical protein